MPIARANMCNRDEMLNRLDCIEYVGENESVFYANDSLFPLLVSRTRVDYKFMYCTGHESIIIISLLE